MASANHSAEVDLPISYDTRYFELADVLEIARDIEAAAVETAITPDAPTGVPAGAWQAV